MDAQFILLNMLMQFTSFKFFIFLGNTEKAFIWSERVKSTLSVVGAVFLDVLKMVCGICRRPLRRKPYCLENVLSSSELSVVAVLVCGHVYHADCLEKRTCDKDKQNPPCPSCLGLLSSVSDSGGRQESPPVH